MPRRTFRYPGLVRAMREVRQALQRPLTGSDRARWARLVAQVLAAASAAAEDAGLTPLALPPASRRAYEYLSALDLAGDPAPEAPGTGLGPPAVRITRIVRWSDRFLTRLRDISARPEQREVEAVRRRLSDVVGDIAIRCERAGASPADLPGPSRRAYQWMSFLV
ncbi:MAG TPA: hypothetical protein VLD63_08290, partial [Anaerolineales bacterium]|nr:hypothetical protein [Anaerolineales bacterium]